MYYFLMELEFCCISSVSSTYLPTHKLQEWKVYNNERERLAAMLTLGPALKLPICFESKQLQI